MEIIEKNLLPKELLKTNGLKKVSDLIDAIYDDKKSKYHHKSKSTISSYVSQALNGKRRPSPELKSAILRHLNKIGAVNFDFEKSLDQSFRHVIELSRTKNSQTFLDQNNSTPSQEQSDLILRNISASKITVLTPDPIETKDTELAWNLKYTLLQKIGIVHSNEVTLAVYEFYITKGGSGYGNIIKFWKAVYDFAIELGIENVSNQLKECSSGKNSRLNVFAIPDDYADVAHGILDIGTINQTGYVLIHSKKIYQDEEQSMLCSYEGEALERTVRRIQSIRLNKSESFPFEKVMPLIIKTNQNLVATSK